MIELFKVLVLMAIFGTISIVLIKGNEDYRIKQMEHHRNLPITEARLENVRFIEGGTFLKMKLTPIKRLLDTEVMTYPWEAISSLKYNNSTKRYEPVLPDMYKTKEGFLLMTEPSALKVDLGKTYLLIVAPTRSTHHVNNVQYLFLRFITSEF